MADDEKEYVPPALYHHCVNTYETMLRKAKLVHPDNRNDAQTYDQNNLDSMMVYEGPLTQLITGDLHLSVPYYTSITRALKRMGCIRQLRRGGGSSESQWELIQEPDIDAFIEAVPKKVVAPSKYDMQAEQIKQLTSQVGELMEFRDAVVAYFGTQPVQGGSKDDDDDDTDLIPTIADGREC
jgi:hypothetical protein